MSARAEQALRDVAHATLRSLPRATPLADVAGALSAAIVESGWCPVCAGAGEVEQSTSPGVDPRDPAHETETLPCPSCVVDDDVPLVRVQPTSDPLEVTVEVTVPPGADAAEVQRLVVEAFKGYIAWPGPAEGVARVEEIPAPGPRQVELGSRVRCNLVGLSFALKDPETGTPVTVGDGRVVMLESPGDPFDLAALFFVVEMDLGPTLRLSHDRVEAI